MATTRRSKAKRKTTAKSRSKRTTKSRRQPARAKSRTARKQPARTHRQAAQPGAARNDNDQNGALGTVEQMFGKATRKTRRAARKVTAEIKGMLNM